jgi:D-beta-D-heptose 7-phosphate kinase / D-beta-D-heptose 1-phosphate adenosyltransferase
MKSIFPNFSSCNIVVVGDVILDSYIMGEVRRLSPEAPVPVVQVKKKTATLGGAGNVALNLIGLGCKVTLLSIRGDDPQGERVSTILKQNGIRDSLFVDSSHLTTTKTRIIGQGQQLLRLDEEEIREASETFERQFLAQFSKELEGADVVILSDYNKGVLNGAVPREVIHRCRAKRTPVFVDPKRKKWERYQKATCITPNVAEIEEITGSSIENDEDTLVEVAHSLRKRYEFDWFLATRGPKGMCLVGPEEPPVFIKVTAREVYDVSGAGDTVIATLAAAIASGLPFPKAAELSNLAAGIVVGKLGAQPISLAELEAAWRINEIGVMGLDKAKITTLDAAQLQVKAWQASGEKVIFTYGCFDLLHPGHIYLLNQAKELGNRLVVGLNSDASAKRLKGPNRPILPEKDRANMLSALNSVDLIVFFQEETPLPLIKALEPDILVKGAARNLEEVAGQEIVESYGGKVHLILPLEGYSTTDIIKNILP